MKKTKHKEGKITPRRSLEIPHFCLLGNSRTIAPYLNPFFLSYVPLNSEKNVTQVEKTTLLENLDLRHHDKRKILRKILIVYINGLMLSNVLSSFIFKLRIHKKALKLNFCRMKRCKPLGIASHQKNNVFTLNWFFKNICQARLYLRASFPSKLNFRNNNASKMIQCGTNNYATS